MDESKALAALQALANAQRLTLIRHLIPAGDQGLAAGHIAQVMGLSSSRLGGPDPRAAQRALCLLCRGPRGDWQRFGSRSA
jgi:hypothetical protein